MTAEFVSHVLCLPPEVSQQVVHGLVRARYTAAESASPDVVRIGPHIMVVGPLHHYVPEWDGTPTTFPATGAFEQLHLSTGHTLRLMPSAVVHETPNMYAIVTVRQRGDSATAEYPDADGLFRVFSDGLPEGAEEHAVELGMAIARRVGGTMVFGDAGHYITPNPLTRIDLTVYSPYWVGEHEMGAAVRQVSRKPAIDSAGAVWRGPNRESVAETSNLDLPLSASELAELNRRADEFDAEALAEATNGEEQPYAWIVPVGKRGIGGSVEVRVHREELPVVALHNKDWQDRAVSYSIVWMPPDETQLHQPSPTQDHLDSREEAIDVINPLAIEVQRLTLGTIVDQDGFVMHPNALIG